MTESSSDASLAARVNADTVRAMKSRDVLALRTLRLLKAAAKNAEIAKRSTLTEEEYLAVIRSQVKMRRDAEVEYIRAGRDEQAKAESEEREVLEGYMPEQLDDNAIRDVVVRLIDENGATGLGDMGKVMKVAMRALQGQADGTRVSATVRELLSERSG